jgi:hypothetical protein
MFLRALTIWSALLVFAILNGGLREAVLAPRFGAPVGHVLSTLVLCLAIVALSYFTTPWIHPVTPRQASAVGLLWLTLTLAFEFGFGALRGRSWAELLADYNLARGRVWVFVLITTAVAPVWAARVHGFLT